VVLDARLTLRGQPAANMIRCHISGNFPASAQLSRKRRLKKIASHGKAGAQVGVNKTDTAYAAQNEMLSFNPLFGSDEVKLKMTPKAVTPFAGMASFFSWLRALEFPKRVAAVMPFEYRSPNAIQPEQTVACAKQ